MTDLPINVTVTTGPAISVTLGTTVARLTFINEDEKLLLDGQGGNSYFIYNSAISKVELWIDGVKKAAWG